MNKILIMTRKNVLTENIFCIRHRVFLYQPETTNSSIVIRIVIINKRIKAQQIVSQNAINI